MNVLRRRPGSRRQETPQTYDLLQLRHDQQLRITTTNSTYVVSLSEDPRRVKMLADSIKGVTVTTDSERVRESIESTEPLQFYVGRHVTVGRGFSLNFTGKTSPVTGIVVEPK